MRITFLKSYCSKTCLKQIIFLSLGCLGIFQLLVLASCKSSVEDEYTVMTGNFRQSIIETGELEAVNAANIVAPQLRWEYGYRFKIVGLAQHGSTVKKGDSVASLDPSGLQRYIITTEEMFETEMASARRLQVQMENNIQELQAQFRSEEATYELKKLELDKTKFESELKRKVKELEYQQASIRLDKVKRNLESKIRQEKLDLSIQNIKVEQRKTDIKLAREALKYLTIYSPNNGIFQAARDRWRGQMVRLGDDIYYGHRIASIPDLSKMKVLSYVNEADISKMKLGMKVIVRLDALPTIQFTGIVNQISKIGTRHENKNIFTTEV
jgi:HlyD family secretion protein